MSLCSRRLVAAIALLLEMGAALSSDGGGGQRDAAVAHAQPADDDEEVCLIQTRHSLGARGAAVALPEVNDLGNTSEEVMSLLQSIGGEVVSGQPAHAELANSADANGEVAGVEHLMKEATGSAAASGGAGQVASDQTASDEGFGNDIAGSKVAGIQVTRNEAVSASSSGTTGVSIGSKAARSKAGDFSDNIVESEVDNAVFANKAFAGAVDREDARREKTIDRDAGAEIAMIKASMKEGEQLDIEVAEKEAERSKAAHHLAEYRRMQHAASSLAELVRSSVLGYQAASAAVGEKVIFVLVLIILLSLLMMVVETRRAQEERGLEKCLPEPLDEDTYGLAIESVIHNVSLISEGSGSRCHWLSRLALTQGVLYLNMFLQMYLLQMVLKLCTSVSVHNVREDYDKYEFHMYGERESHTWLTVNGKHRGIGDFFDARNFDTLPNDLKLSVCNIPFSQPIFFIVLVFIWTLVCVREIKLVHDSFRSLIINTERCDSMKNAHTARSTDEEGTHELGHKSRTRSKSHILSSSAGRNEVLIQQLTIPIKAYIFFFVLVPRLLVTCFLCYVGCRWLAATNNFADLVLNAVALEFVMGLKDLLYLSLVPNRNKRDIQNTWMQPPYKHEPANFSFFLGTFIWFFVALLWCCVYTFHIQRVLPEYNWDVRNTCEHWLAEATKT